MQSGLRPTCFIYVRTSWLLAEDIERNTFFPLETKVPDTFSIFFILTLLRTEQNLDKISHQIHNWTDYILCVQFCLLIVHFEQSSYFAMLNIVEPILGIPSNSEIVSSFENSGIGRNCREFQELMQLDQCRLGLGCRMMIEFSESEGINFGGRTGSVIFKIAEQDLFFSF